MKESVFRILCLAISAAATFTACSVSSKIPDGQYSLARNVVAIDGADGLRASELTPYIKQQPASRSIASMLAGKSVEILDEKLVSVSEDKILGHLEYLGYYDAKVHSQILYKNKKASVIYSVEPGERIRIRDIVYDVPEGSFSTDFYADTTNVSVRPGDFLSEKSLEQESERSASAMRGRGYYGFTKNYYYFEADTLHGRDSVILKMQVREYTRNENESNAKPLHKSWIGDVTVSLPKRLPFRREVITDLNTIRPGELYDENTINTTYSRLRYLQLFNNVGIELSPQSEDTVRCDINLSTSRIQGFNADFEMSTNSNGLIGISPQFNYYHKNIFHGGEWLNLGFVGNFQFKLNDKTRSDEFGVSAGISFPKFLGLRNDFFTSSHIPRTEIKAAYNYQDRPEYTRSIVSTSIGYTGRFYGRYSYQLYPLQVNFVHLYNLDPLFDRTLESNPFMKYAYQNHFDAGLGGTLLYSTAKDVNSRESFHYYRLALDMSGNVLSIFKRYMKTDESGEGLIWGTPFAQYVRGELSLGRTWRFGREDDQAVAAHFTAGLGYAYGNTSALPFEKQFYCGGANSMRGWQARSLGPGRAPLNEAFIIPSQTGDVKLEANLEYRFNLFWKLEGALFGDLGNVWTLNGSDDDPGRFDKDFYKTLGADWGYGVRCDLNFIVVRVDMGLKLYDPSESVWRGPSMWYRRDGFAVHFGVGYPF